MKTRDTNDTKTPGTPAPGLMAVDFFHLTESKNFDPNKAPVCYRLILADDLSPAQCLKEYHDQGYPKGSHRAGCNEIQCDKWMVIHNEGKNLRGLLNFTSKRQRSQVTIWDETFTNILPNIKNN